MFEDSTFESRGSIHTRSRGWSLAALFFNATILLALVLIPLIYPEALPTQVMNLLLIAPPPPVAAQPAPAEQAKAQAFHGRPEMVGLQLNAPSRIPTGIVENTRPEESAEGANLATMNFGSGIPGGIEVFRGAPVAAAALVYKPKLPTPISSGIAAGLLIRKTIPQYPPIARSAHIEGTVVLQATISKAGTIENLRVASGPAMLQQAAIEAVRNWLYRPYLLNGEPVEVETAINVNFTLSR